MTRLAPDPVETIASIAAGYRPPAPDAAALIDWPEDFGLRFALFVDTEEEFDWAAPFDRANRATTAIAALPAAHKVFVDAGLKPVYLVDHPVATDPRAIDIIRALLDAGTADVGAHLHPWVTPPFTEPVNIANSYAGNLGGVLEAEKIDALHRAIVDAFGRSPIVYRAGRYGIGPDSLALLERRGYRIDTSMRSLFDYSAGYGPDYAHLDVTPFWCGAEGSLIELPLSTTFTGGLRRGGRRLHGSRFGGALARSRLLSRIPLTPEGVPVNDALEAIRTMAGDGIRLLSFSYHSPSLVPGHTPYVRDAADLVTFYRWWDAVFALLAKLGAASATLDDIVAAAWATRD